MEVLEAVKTRRSVRRFKPTPVPEEALEQVMEAARWAPSWANTQCWRFIVVRESRLKAELAATLRGRPAEGTGEAGRNAAANALLQAPLVIVACAELGKSGYFQGRVSTDKGDWYMFDVALAMQNLVLAAHSLRLGTVYVGLFDAEEAALILHVPDGFRVVSMTPLGYPDEQPGARPRKELSEIVFYDGYGQSRGS